MRVVRPWLRGWMVVLLACSVVSLWFATYSQRSNSPLLLPLRFPHETCLAKSRLFGGFGQSTNAAWIICYAGLEDAPRPVIFYSFGLGQDISTEEDLLRTYPALQIFAFDPTPNSVHHVLTTTEAWPQEMRRRFHFYHFGLGDRDELATFMLPANPNHISMTLADKQLLGDGDEERTKISAQILRFDTIQRMLGHPHGPDILKMDIEGCEFGVLEELVRSNGELFQGTNQIMFEFHSRNKDLADDRARLLEQLVDRLGYSFIPQPPKMKNEYTYVR